MKSESLACTYAWNWSDEAAPASIKPVTPRQCSVEAILDSLTVSADALVSARMTQISESDAVAVLGEVSV